jgi:hypothetical protein
MSPVSRESTVSSSPSSRQQEKNPFIIVEDECPRFPRRGWAEMIKKVFEVDPLTCPQCQGKMCIIAFITDYAVVDRIINHLKLTFVAEIRIRISFSAVAAK